MKICRPRRDGARVRLVALLGALRQCAVRRRFAPSPSLGAAEVARWLSRSRGANAAVESAAEATEEGEGYRPRGRRRWISRRARSEAEAATYQSPGAEDDDAGDSAKVARSSSRAIAAIQTNYESELRR